MTSDEIFLKFSADKLTQLAERIGKCLDQLNDDQIWARGSESENAIGNLVLHLTGNVRQWIGTGVAGKPDVRVRDKEFAASGGLSSADLKTRLLAGVEEAVETIRSLDAQRLQERTTVQKYDVTVLEAIYHVVEHFAGHTGQIIFGTKLLTSRDLAFYGHLQQSSHGEKVP
jgi:uncharacterized damage-inducible protein DinB